MLIFWRLLLWFFIIKIFWSFFLCSFNSFMYCSNFVFDISPLHYVFRVYFLSFFMNLLKFRVYLFDSIEFSWVLGFFVVSYFAFVIYYLALSVFSRCVSNVLRLDFFWLIYFSSYWNLSINSFRMFYLIYSAFSICSDSSFCIVCRRSARNCVNLLKWNFFLLRNSSLAFFSWISAGRCSLWRLSFFYLEV